MSITFASSASEWHIHYNFFFTFFLLVSVCSLLCAISSILYILHSIRLAIQPPLPRDLSKESGVGVRTHRQDGEKIYIECE